MSNQELTGKLKFAWTLGLVSVVVAVIGLALVFSTTGPIGVIGKVLVYGGVVGGIVAGFLSASTFFD